jgi:hypothetical protein
MSSHEILSTAEPEPMISMSQDSLVELSPEPQTLEEEEIQPSEFTF